MGGWVRAWVRVLLAYQMVAVLVAMTASSMRASAASVRMRPSSASRATSAQVPLGVDRLAAKEGREGWGTREAEHSAACKEQ